MDSGGNEMPNHDDVCNIEELIEDLQKLADGRTSVGELLTTLVFVDVVIERWAVRSITIPGLVLINGDAAVVHIRE